MHTIFRYVFIKRKKKQFEKRENNASQKRNYQNFWLGTLDFAHNIEYNQQADSDGPHRGGVQDSTVVFEAV